MNITVDLGFSAADEWECGYLSISWRGDGVVLTPDEVRALRDHLSAMLEKLPRCASCGGPMAGQMQQCRECGRGS